MLNQTLPLWRGFLLSKDLVQRAYRNCKSGRRTVGIRESLPCAGSVLEQLPFSGSVVPLIAQLSRESEALVHPAALASMVTLVGATSSISFGFMWTTCIVGCRRLLWAGFCYRDDTTETFFLGLNGATACLEIRREMA